MTLRDEFEMRCGRFDDGQYRHILELALDDQRQYITLTDAELKQVMDPVCFPPCSRELERLAEVRERLLEAMAIIANIMKRRKMH